VIFSVEDDDNIRELIEYALTAAGLPTRGFSRPSELFKALSAGCPELILLDIMLPEESGLSVLKKLKENSETAGVPVVLLTALDTEADTVRGLDAGADDYLAKPFGMNELVARVKARLRAAKKEVSSCESYRLGALFVSVSRRVAEVNGAEISLTQKEFETLCLLLSANGAVITREELLSRVWGYSFRGESRTVDVHIRSLRQKLGEAGSYVQTVRGVGYKITDTRERL